MTVQETKSQVLFESIDGVTVKFEGASSFCSYLNLPQAASTNFTMHK